MWTTVDRCLKKSFLLWTSFSTKNLFFTKSRFFRETPQGHSWNLETTTSVKQVNNVKTSKYPEPRRRRLLWWLRRRRLLRWRWLLWRRRLQQAVCTAAKACRHDKNIHRQACFHHQSESTVKRRRDESTTGLGKTLSGVEGIRSATECRDIESTARLGRSRCVDSVVAAFLGIKHDYETTCGMGQTSH